MSHRIVCFILYCLLLVVLQGCGKEGMPKPQDTQRAFQWQEVRANQVGETCINFSGLLTGSYQNLDEVRLELASMETEDDCEGCPFLAKELIVFSRTQAGFNQENGSIMFTYCPRKLTPYRWRLVAMSVFNKIPHSLSKVHSFYFTNSEPALNASSSIPTKGAMQN